MDNPQLVVIRVWQDGNRFRASVRAADHSPPRLFTAADELALFLGRAAQAAAAAQPPHLLLDATCSRRSSS